MNKDRIDKKCCSHHINARSLRELLLFTIRTVSQYAISNKEDFIARVREASALRRDNTVKEVKRKLNKDKRRYEELDVLYKRLYESYAIGKISEEKFDLLSKGYEQEQKDLKTAIVEAERSVAEFEKDSVCIDSFLSLATKYTDFTELTSPMLNEFVEKILVHAPDRSTGERMQEVEIYLNFIGNIEVPAPEPTPEELEQMKIDQYWKDRYWKRRDYELARRKRKLQERKVVEAAEFVRQQDARIKALREEIRQHPPEKPFEARQVPSA